MPPRQVDVGGRAAADRASHACRVGRRSVAIRARAEPDLASPEETGPKPPVATSPRQVPGGAGRRPSV